MHSFPTDVFKIFNSLEGSWQLERAIPNQGLVKGEASFTPYQQEVKSGTVLHYEEKGILTLTDKKEFNFSREYFYHFNNDQISVFFVEDDKPGKLFHILKFSQRFKETDLMRASARHHCRDDIYDATYLFQNENQFTLSYRVYGPTKNYSSETVFQKNKFTT